MKQSKLWVLSLVFVMIVGLLAACSSNKSEGSDTKTDTSDKTAATDDAKKDDGGSKENVELSMLFAESLFGGIHEDLIKEFESSHPNIKVKAETLPDAGIFDALRTRISTGEVPDMFQINIGHVTTGLADQEGYIYDLKQLESSKNFAESIVNATSINGKQALFTLGVGVLGFPYNKKILAEAGYNEPLKSWDELLDAGKKLKEKGKDLLVYSSKWETGIANVFHWTFGTHALKDEAFKTAYLSNKVDWSKPEYREILAEGFKRFKELNEYVRTGSFTNEYAIAQQSFTNNESAMILGGTWEAGTLRKLAPDMDLGFMNLPYAPDDQNAYIFVPEDGIAINAKGKHIEETKTFLNWLFSKETYAKIQAAKGSMSAQPGVGTLDESYKDVPNWLNTNRVISFGNTGPVPSPTWIALGNAAQEYTFKGDLDKAIDKFIAEYNKTKAQ